MKRFVKQLLQWYEEHKRVLPWRDDPSPYAVWISEVMLQQTTVPAVIGRFGPWMERFPDVRSLAAAEERDVLSEWEGLGYYQRASRLHGAARLIVERHGGRIPSEEQSLRRLPGIGPYIASAIQSLAFGADVAAIDANVCRVFMRLHALRGRPGRAQVRQHVQKVATQSLPAGDSSRFNQGLMDFGSLICRPGAPDCGHCFATSICRALKEGLQEDIPEKRRKKVQEIETAVAVFTDNSRVYIQRRPRHGLFAGMWEFPGGKVKDRESGAEAVVREVREELEVSCRVLKKITSFVHFYTRFKVTLHAFRCSTAQILPQNETHRWVELENVGEYPMPSANRRLIGQIREDFGCCDMRGVRLKKKRDGGNITRR